MKSGDNVDRTLLARRMLNDDAPLPAGLLHASIQRSWERTRANGVRPRDRHLFGHWVSAREARRVQELHRDLVSLALPDMQHLWASIRSPHWIVLLTNREGTIVHSMGEGAVAPRELSPFRCGRRLVETELGTNAPIVVTADAIPVVVQRNEHFLEELQGFDCAAVPIFGIDGKVAGVLDVTGFHAQDDRRSLERVMAAANSIENRAFETAQSDFIVRIHEDPRYIGTPSQGVALVREDGVVLSANRAAQAMLAMAGAIPTVTTRLGDLFDQEGARTLSMLRREPIVAHTQRGARLFLEICQNASRTRVSISRSSEPPASDRALDAMLAKAHQIFPRGLPILIQGETGTGKEWVARKLHEECVKDGPFVAVNCAALAEGIAESELFGHAEGAYTGSRRGGAKGRIQQAHRGTLFLDEIGDMPLHLQTRLLRVLETRAVTPVGSSTEVLVDIRVVSASHRDLQALVRGGHFREDLYFRLNGLTVKIPALREREDREALLDHLLASLAGPGESQSVVADYLRAQLINYRWPGNVRQLRHALHVGGILAGPGREITADMLPSEIFDSPIEGAATSDVPRTLDQIQRDTVRRIVAENKHNISAAARALGVSRTTLYKYLKDE